MINMKFFKKHWWKSSYKLPVSFILFFVLAFFLIGEQLPALPTYLFGSGLSGDGPDKLHILDLSFPDAIHRPIAYILIGTVIWILFRIFTWPLAWIIGASLWALEQSFLTPLDQRPSISNILFFTFTFWIVLTLVPYFIYRAVDYKWGKKGKRNAILIAIAINLLLLGFFAYQIFYLHNSYSQQMLPTNTCPDRLVEEIGETPETSTTTVYWKNKTYQSSAEVYNFVKENCPGVMERIEKP
ncbi:hypothetical protein HYT25_04220 [Candidatus Pacearchaeota archaeon]|nr:hypothetical protein [Candidatus Pacearchaeota archaeon]